MNNKFISLIIITSLISGIFIGELFVSNASAGFFQDIFDRVTPFFGGKDNVKNDSEAADENIVKELYSPTVDYEEAVINAVEAGSKSVVSIIISKDLPVLERCPYNPFRGFGNDFFNDFFGNDFGTQFYAPCDSGKTEKQEIGGGSGFIISEDGLIITNKHVVRDAKAEYTVLVNDGSKFEAEVLARDPVLDIALIKINAPSASLYPAKLGDSDSIKLGQTAIAIGNALGEFRNTVSVGAVSGLSRSITASDGSGTQEKIEGLIQTDAAINQGNSGGPLLNLKGEVIGINTAIVAGAQNIGFAIPINQAKRDIESVKRTGTIKIPYLGIRYFMINAEFSKKQNLLVDYGALIRGTNEGPGVIAGSPAAKAGLKAEDVITAVNGEKLDGGKSLVNIIQKYNIGDKVSLVVHRGDKIINTQVILEERPDSEG